MRCLAPGCRTPSRGPRFRYLCPKHEKASDKTVDEWRAKRQAVKHTANGATTAIQTRRAPSA